MKPGTRLPLGDRRLAARHRGPEAALRHGLGLGDYGTPAEVEAALASRARHRRGSTDLVLRRAPEREERAELEPSSVRDERIEERALKSEALDELASVLEPGRKTPGRRTRSLLTALALVGAQLVGIRIQSHPGSPSEDAGAAPIPDAIARASRDPYPSGHPRAGPGGSATADRCSAVRPDEERRPLALHPQRPHAVRGARPRSAERVQRLDKRVAADLSAEGVMLYRPLPEGQAAADRPVQASRSSGGAATWFSRSAAG